MGFDTILLAILSGYVGFLFGVAKFFREQKQKAYTEILPPIVKVAFDPETAIEPEFNQALMKLWLYGSKEVARKVDRAVFLIHNHSRGDVTTALQEAITEMRALQILPRQKRLSPKEVNHIYSKIKNHQ